MRLSSGQLSTIFYWCVCVAAMTVLAIGPAAMGCAIFALGYVLFRVPYVNDNKSFETFAKARPYVAYGLAGITALSAAAVFFDAIRNHVPFETSDHAFFITHRAWIPAAAMLALCVAHEIWLFPRLKEPSSEG